MTTLVWFRRDCRLTDHPGIHWASSRGPVAFGYVVPSPDYPWAMGAAQQSWLHGTLASLSADLGARQAQLLLAKGDPLTVIPQWVTDLSATAVVVADDPHPQHVKWDQQLAEHLAKCGVLYHRVNALRLTEPFEQYKADGAPFRVFTPFWKRLQTLEVPLPLPDRPVDPAPPIPTATLSSLGLKPHVPWDLGFDWVPGREGALALLSRFLPQASAYGLHRNTPSRVSTSCLSPYLALGVVSPREVWHSVSLAQAPTFLSQVGWREFAYHTLEGAPQLVDTPLQPSFERFPWSFDADTFQRWTSGQTGYPLVDAGMRELWQTGWMHNRVRMVVASFLVKHLLMPWQEGAAWFWDTLIDADLPNNTLGWQWVAGCGVDAAPYFRVFNPFLQSKKFDPQGRYIRQWVPELAHLSSDRIHDPDGVPGYPRPMVDHATARQRALDAWATLR